MGYRRSPVASNGRRVDARSIPAVGSARPFSRPSSRGIRCSFPHASEIGVDGFGLGGPAYGRLARLHTLAFGGFVLRDLACGYSTQREGAFADPTTAANLGGAILRRFTVTFDYRGRRLAVRGNAAFALPDRIDCSGLFLIATDTGTIAVLGVCLLRIVPPPRR